MARGKRRRRGSGQPRLRRTHKSAPRAIGVAKALECLALRSVKESTHCVRIFVDLNGICGFARGHPHLAHYCEQWCCTFPAVTVEHGFALCFRHASGFGGDLGTAPAGLECVGQESAGTIHTDPLRNVSDELVEQLVRDYYAACINGYFKHEALIPAWALGAYTALRGRMA